MNSHQPESDNGTQYHKSEYKLPCTGRGCKNVQTEFFDIAIKIKSGWLCASCKKSLEEDGFVFYRIVVNLGIGEGKICQSYGKLKEDGKSEDVIEGKKLHVQ